MNQLVYLVPLFPLIGFILNGLFRKAFSKTMTGVIGSGAILASFVVSVILFNSVAHGQVVQTTLFDFITVGKLSIPFAFPG